MQPMNHLKTNKLSFSSVKQLLRSDNKTFSQNYLSAFESRVKHRKIVIKSFIFTIEYIMTRTGCSDHPCLPFTHNPVQCQAWTWISWGSPALLHKLASCSRDSLFSFSFWSIDYASFEWDKTWRCLEVILFRHWSLYETYPWLLVQ